MKLKLTSAMLGTSIECTAIKSSSNTFRLNDNAIFKYSDIAPSLYVDHNVYMVEATGHVIRVYIQTLNKSGRWSKNVVVSNDIKAVIYEA